MCSVCMRCGLVSVSLMDLVSLNTKLVAIVVVGVGEVAKDLRSR